MFSRILLNQRTTDRLTINLFVSSSVADRSDLSFLAHLGTPTVCSNFRRSKFSYVSSVSTVAYFFSLWGMLKTKETRDFSTSGRLLQRFLSYLIEESSSSIQAGWEIETPVVSTFDIFAASSSSTFSNPFSLPRTLFSRL